MDARPLSATQTVTAELETPASEARLSTGSRDAPGSNDADGRPDGSDRSVFDTDISALFPKRRRFGVIDLLLVAGLVAWAVLMSDVRIWLRGEGSSFATGTAVTGATRAPLPDGSEGDTASGDEAVATSVPTRTGADAVVATVAAGMKAFEAGDFETARGLLERAVARSPDHAEAHNTLGHTLVRMRRVQEAITCFEAALRLDPDRWSYQVDLGGALDTLGQWSQSAVRYRRAAELAPEDVGTRANLGRALSEWGDDRGAAEVYLEAIALAPGEPTLYLSLARSYERLGRPADAHSAYARYLDIGSESAQADVVRARMDALQPPLGTGLGPARDR